MSQTESSGRIGAVGLVRSVNVGTPCEVGRNGRLGAYLRIVEEGDVGAGDEIRIVAVPAHGLTVGDVAHIYHHDRRSARQLLDVAELSEAWQGWAERTLERLSHPRRARRALPRLLLTSAVTNARH